MIRTAIRLALRERHTTQVALCSSLGITVQNFNGFLAGRRPLPYAALLRVLKYLRLSVGTKDGVSCGLSADFLPDIIRNRLAAGMRIVDLAAASGVSASCISSYLNGKRTMPIRSLENILDALGLRIMPVSPKPISF